MRLFKVTEHIVAILCLLAVVPVMAQNLVKNPSFEQYVDCPEKLGNLNADVIDWSTPTEGSTDYFNSCSKAMGTPKNFNGTQPADFGQGYAGLYLYAPDDYREYLQVELFEPLVEDENYTISFYVSLAERSDFAVKDFGVLFSTVPLQVATKKELSKRLLYQQKNTSYHAIEIGYTNFYRDTNDWVLVHSEFIAKGSERFMILGNFKTNARTRMFKTEKYAKQGAYYYIDMVSVERTERKDMGSDLVSGASGKHDFELDKTHVFTNVLFDFDEFILLDSAKKEVARVFDYLKKDSTLTIEINGHTDNIGSEGYNQVLSNKRAKAVADYLVQLGLSGKKIKWNGFGGENPVSENSSVKGRQRNRRVEFIIAKE
ncbi:OmpA family protein [Maribacter algicola]|uniref:OmpA family protein n=1 Tax=Meishania litoralis TaxID=3434685 RepID=A0ACC7LG57_9FLAO